MLHGAPYAVSLNNQTRSAPQVSAIPILAGIASEHWEVTPGSAVIWCSRAENRSLDSFQLILRAALSTSRMTGTIVS